MSKISVLVDIYVQDKIRFRTISVDGILLTVYHKKKHTNRFITDYDKGMSMKRLPFLPELSEEEFFQMSLVWDNKMSIELVRSFQEHVRNVTIFNSIIRGRRNYVIDLES